MKACESSKKVFQSFASCSVIPNTSWQGNDRALQFSAPFHPGSTLLVIALPLCLNNSPVT